MELTASHILLSLHLSTLSLTATLPPPNILSLLTYNHTLSPNTTLLSLSSAPPPTDIPNPYTFTPHLPPGHSPATLRIKIQGYGAADMDPQALLVAFNKARVETEYDRDLEEKIEEGRLVYKSKGAVVAFTPRRGVTRWEDWDEAANGFYAFFLERAIEQKDAFPFIFELLADGIEGTIGFGTVTGRGERRVVV